MAKKELTYKGKTEEELKKMSPKEIIEYAKLLIEEFEEKDKRAKDPTICECDKGRLEILAESLTNRWKNEDGIAIKHKTIFYECGSCKGLFIRDQLKNSATEETTYLGYGYVPSRLTREEILNYATKSRGMAIEIEIIRKRK